MYCMPLLQDVCDISRYQIWGILWLLHAEHCGLQNACLHVCMILQLERTQRGEIRNLRVGWEHNTTITKILYFHLHGHAVATVAAAATAFQPHMCPLVSCTLDPTQELLLHRD
jgi:hypothetical protein